MKSINEKIKELESSGITKVNMIAFITKTSAEVVFYGDVEGKRYQSNNMIEEDKVDSDVVDTFYSDIAKIIRADKKFDESQMAIVKADSGKCKIEYSDKKTSTYKLLKEWEAGQQK